MIIDCHGHYTTAPAALEAWRKRQVAALGDPAQGPTRAELVIADDEIRASLESAQLKMQRERGTDLTIFSPRASFMAHHVGTEATSREWSEICNDLVARVCGLYPDNFVGVCQLPQSPGVPPERCIPELERCVNELGFIGCNLNPDPVRRALEGAAADRPLVVSALREDGRARRAGDGPREHVVQPVLPRDRARTTSTRTRPPSCSS